MEITINEENYAVVKPGMVRAYRKAPGDLNLAAQAAAHYAAKNGERMIVVPGNSYGHSVYHIARESDDLAKFTAMRSSVNALAVMPNGQVQRVTAK